MYDRYNNFDIYLRDIGRYPRITAEREQELAGIINKSKRAAEIEKAVTELVNANLRLVVHCLRDFNSYLNNPAVSISRMDLICEGNIGLMKAARKYNPDFRSDNTVYETGPTFSSYACTNIKSSMQRAVKLSRFIHIPEYHFSYWARLDELNRDVEITDLEIMDKLDISEEKLRTLRKGRLTSATML